MWHRARDCPDRRRRDKEAPAKTEKQEHEDRKKTVSAINKDDDQSLGEDGELRVEKLRRQLQEPEIEVALRKRSATMYGVTPESSNTASVELGQAVYTDIEFEGCRVKALVDTGSPATIVSLNCMLLALAKGRPTNQTPAEWELAVRQHLKPPEITLCRYGGGSLDIVGQLTATIQSGPYRKMAVVLVQNRTPEDLLLGTDLQPYLGFQLSQKSIGGPMVELLPCLEVHPSEESPKPTDQEQSPADSSKLCGCQLIMPVLSELGWTLRSVQKRLCLGQLTPCCRNQAGMPRRG